MEGGRGLFEQGNRAFGQITACFDTGVQRGKGRGGTEGGGKFGCLKGDIPYGKALEPSTLSIPAGTPFRALRDRYRDD